MNNTGIYIGTAPETVEAVKYAILEILNARADQATIQIALEILSKATKSPDYTTVSGCNIEMSPNEDITESEQDE